MKNLIIIRKQKNLTQTQIARLLNIEQSTYSGYETGKSKPDIETLKKIADFYDVSIDYLCGNQTKNIIELHQLSETKKEAIQKIINNNERIALRINAYKEHKLCLSSVHSFCLVIFFSFFF